MKYIDSEKLIAEIERKRDSALERQKNLEKIGQETVLNEMIAFELNRLISFIGSLQQEPLIHTELCTLIACDVIQATAKKAIEKPQDKDKEEDLMVKKMEYLNMLEKSFFQQEQLAQKEQMLKDNPVIMPVEDFQALIDSHAKRVEADYKAKMLDGAVEGMVCATITGTNAISFLSPLPDELNAGDKVKVIVIKEDESHE